ncbi:hypothetical protein ACHHYP_13328 [Achlya hypogyna]|uniref:Myb-like domain-containing protein n=1 Tax=Achlya hypogyna TaxID=1202772 RepID=A0A1V9YFJ0_ACHHY|nr:hypothetical protein ACHHYP_13328 [Achlya hypogyna]
MLQDDEDPSTLCDVFAQMLQVNEDMVAAIAEHQNWADRDAYRSLETAHAYQRILHKNLIEMANFVDSLCGVFVNVDHAKSSGIPTQNLPDDVTLLKKRKAAADPSTLPSAEPSALLATIQATEHFRARRRTEKEFASSQLRIREQEMAKKPEAPPTPKAPTLLRPSPLPLPPPAPVVASKNRPVAAKEECLDCHRLGKAVTDCRALYKHTAPSWKSAPCPPPPLFAPFPVPMLPMYPPPFGRGAMLPPGMLFVPPTMAPSASKLSRLPKRMCEQCRAEHQSVYQCRTVLGHTAPEWKRQAKAAVDLEEPGARSYSRWTDKESHTFHELVEVHGYTDPVHLAPFIPTKDVKQIKSYLQRYNKQRSADERRRSPLCSSLAVASLAIAVKTSFAPKTRSPLLIA